MGKTYPVKGKVTFEGGDVQKLVESNVEFQLQDDPSVRAYGDIKADGSFSLGMLHEGKHVEGVKEGTYQARILLGGDGADDENPGRRSPIHPRFLRFETSKLSFKVPAEGEINIKVSKK